MYSTTIKYDKMGDALVIPIDKQDDAWQSKSPHVTIAYFKTGMPRNIDHLLSDYEKNYSSVTFTTSKWGRQSDLIHGELDQIVKEIQNHLQSKGLTFDIRPTHMRVRN